MPTCGEHKAFFALLRATDKALEKRTTLKQDSAHMDIHDCSGQNQEILKLILIPPAGSTKDWLLRADLSTMVAIGIVFCPWCGVELPTKQ